MEIQIGAAKINKYASSDSGDTLEVVERPNGGLSIVLADGQRSGKSAKRISNMVVRKVVSLLAEGVRDGAAARAASDYLFAERSGKVLSTLNIISIDLQSKTLVISRNNPAPMVIIQSGDIRILDQESQPVGVYRNTRPAIDQIPLEENLTVIAFSDGLVHAGDRSGEKIEMSTIFNEIVVANLSAQDICDRLLAKALELDENRPVDDISVVVVQVLPKQGDIVRRLSVRLPIS